jgi:hypothetical protein
MIAYALLLIGAVISYRRSGKKAVLLLAVISLIMVCLNLFSNIYVNLNSIEEMDHRLMSDIQIFGGLIVTILLGIYGLLLCNENRSQPVDADNPYNPPENP